LKIANWRPGKLRKETNVKIRYDLKITLSNLDVGYIINRGRWQMILIGRKLIRSPLMFPRGVCNLTQVIAMTKLQKIAVGVVLLGAIAYQQYRISQLKHRIDEIVNQPAGDNMLNAQLAQLKQERDAASNELASVEKENAALKNRPTEVLKLRGEVGTLQDQKTKLGQTAAISKLTATPDVRQLMHDQQKAGMGAVFKQFAAQMKLDKDQTDKFNNLLADHVLQDVDYITTALRDKTSVDEMTKAFASDNASLEQSIQDMLGADGVGQYRDYSKNLLGNLSSLQFASELTGSDEEKKAKSEKLRLAIDQETQAALASAGLPSDFQAVPILNFINIASESQAEQNLKLLEGIYQRVAANAGSYLSAQELAAFQTFAGKARSNSDAALKANRSLMAPIGGQ